MNFHSTPSPEPTGRNDLAEGFVNHLLQWAEQAGAPRTSLAVLAAAGRQVSLATQSGHVCAQLDSVLGLFPDQSPTELVEHLLASRMVAASGARPTLPEVLPLVLDGGGRLYLHRYFAYERRLAANLRKRAERHTSPPTAQLRQQLDSLFADNARRLGDRPDWQKLAAALAWRSKLTIISGGPGTGKTTTVVALLACLLTENPGLRVALAAPTGKAAARMLEALRQRAGDLPVELQARLPRESHTLHRLLGVTPEPGRFRHHAENPLPIDALVVDEASMLDLALACRLCDAVPPDARLILLGDKDQLSAVEAGAVFSEVSADPTLTAACIAELSSLTATPAACIQPPPAITATPLADCVVWFSESHRFASTSGIGRLAADINGGRGNEACDWLAGAHDPSVSWLPDGSADLAPATRQAIVDGYHRYCTALVAALAAPASRRRQVFAAFDGFRVLCALRETARGVRAINALVTRHLLQLGAGVHPGGPRSPWYVGRPVMVLRNDYVLKLFNGDVGICLPDDGGELMVWFPEQDAGFRPVAPVRLPEHDTAFAMTVHKAQGSEFESVFLLLPEQANRVLTRELLYTGITRASTKVAVVGSREVLVGACANRTRRHSGLIARLGEVGP
ncbi:MAG: exodeoxyribonuclease V subunit alpha [Candidatus Accumulibacter phosphatis]|uniref:exodeoxyribonuclease V subunit alpha n=1 Tax=Candidatus Accumulibacter phosphatis TaxID=327160 RepID=UPI001A5ED36E|nr:exodeoxyribonuclease V subunit alpha [Candidatus Accumulibacter phosphatis]